MGAQQHLNEHQQQNQHQQQAATATTGQPPVQQNGPKPRGRRKKIRTEPIRPICPQCEKQFSNQSALTKHKLTHSDERKFACQQCSKAFKRHDHLTGHMQTHSNRKPFNCTIQGCDKTYCDARSLRRHKENIHHIITPRELNANNHHHNHHHHLHHSNNSITRSTGDLYSESMNDLNNNNNININHNLSLDSMNNGSSCGAGGTLLNLDNQNHHNQHYDIKLSPTTGTYQANPMSTTSTTSTEHLDPAATDGSGVYLTTPSNGTEHQHQHQGAGLSQFSRRRLQRLHSDSAAYGCNSGDGQHGYLACNTGLATNPHNTTALVSQQAVAAHHNTGNITHHQAPPHHASNQYLNAGGPASHHHQHQHASYSADYACTQHFFDVNVSVNMNVQHMDHAISGTTLPLSADSVTDSGLDLNAHYEQLTPSHQQPPQSATAPSNTAPAPPPSQQSAPALQQQPPQQQQAQQQLTQQQQQQPQPQLQNLQPSDLLRRRIQRLHSDQSGYSSQMAGRGYLACNTAPISAHAMAGTQHVPHTGNGHQHHHASNQYLNNHQQHAYSADYASSQQFNFDFANMNGHHQHHHQHHMDHAISSGTIPHSADSVTDSGLDLNAHYEQLTPSHQHTPAPQQPGPQLISQNQQAGQQPHPGATQLPSPLQLQGLQQQQQQQQQRYHQHQQHVSYSAGYANAQHFSFDSAPTPQPINGCGAGGGGGASSLSTCASTIDREINNNLMNEQHNSYVTYVSQDEELRS